VFPFAQVLSQSSASHGPTSTTLKDLLPASPPRRVRTTCSTPHLPAPRPHQPPTASLASAPGLDPMLPRSTPPSTAPTTSASPAAIATDAHTPVSPRSPQLDATAPCGTTWSRERALASCNPTIATHTLPQRHHLQIQAPHSPRTPHRCHRHLFVMPFVTRRGSKPCKTSTTRCYTTTHGP
jgi:hypothetical protein